MDIITGPIPRSNKRQKHDNKTVGFKKQITENGTNQRHDTEYPIPEIKHTTATPENRKKYITEKHLMITIERKPKTCYNDVNQNDTVNQYHFLLFSPSITP